MQKRGFAKQSFLARAVIEIKEGKSVATSEEWFDFAEEDTAQCTGQIQVTIVEC